MASKLNIPMRLPLLNICVIFGVLSGLVSNLVAADDVCEYPVDHDLFETGDHMEGGQEIKMSITSIFDNQFGTWKIKFADDAGIYSGITATGWCIDVERMINRGEYMVDSYSPYDGASHPPTAVDKPENIGALNWFVNNYNLGQEVNTGNDDCPPKTLGWTEMQAAVWSIIDSVVAPNLGTSKCIVEYMVKDAEEKGKDFEPCCAENEEMAVILVSDTDQGEITHQVVIAEIKLSDIPNACPEYNGGGGKDRPTTSPTTSPTTGPTRGISEPIIVPLIVPTKAPTAGVVGDPHFRTWTGEMYDFHGICDLVLLHNPGFNNGLGMKIHIRSKKTLQWSYISNVAIVIGDDESIEIMGTGKQTKYWMNGIERKKLTRNEMDLPDTISGFQIHYRKVNSQQKEFVIDLKNGGEKINIVVWRNKMIRVDIVNGTKENFGGSLGLMGTFGKDSKKMARDNSTIIEDTLKFGQEWQVQVNEEQLFHNIEGPQAPSHCDIPSKTAVRRRLGQSTVSKEVAEVACSKVQNTDEFNLCVFDVMVSSDIAVAGAY